MLGKMAVWILPLVPRPVVRGVASRYVAGTTINDAMTTVRDLNDKSIRATIDILGEDSNANEADSVLTEYMEIANKIKALGLNSGISVKPSHFAAQESEGEAFERIKKLVNHCADSGVFVRLDMESSALTDLTLDYYYRLAKDFSNIGIVMQAYLKRTANDMKKLAVARANVRLCKGIYTESATIAYKSRADIKANYMEIARSFLAQSYLKDNNFLGIATHDREIIQEMDDFITKRQISTDKFEFQSLLGVPIDDVIRKMVGKGRFWRVYVPYGKEWYDYSVRRLKENPKIATYVIKHMFGGKA